MSDVSTVNPNRENIDLENVQVGDYLSFSYANYSET